MTTPGCFSSAAATSMPRFKPMIPTVTLWLGRAPACASTGPDARATADPAEVPRNVRRERGRVTVTLRWSSTWWVERLPSAQERFERSGEDVVDHPTVDVRQAKITTRVTIGQSLVIQSEQVEDGGVQVVVVDLVFDG